MVLGELDSGAQRLVMVLCLPLIDGVFATLLVTGTINTFSNIVVVALTIFTGAGALAVLYSHAETPAEARRLALQATPVLIGGAVAVALIAPVFAQLFYVNRLQYAAALVVLVIAAGFLELDFVEKLPPHAILLTGFVLSLKDPEALTLSFTYVEPALVTALVAVVGLQVAASINPERLSINYLQTGGAIVLILIALSLFGLNIPSELTLGVFGGSVAAALR